MADGEFSEYTYKPKPKPVESEPETPKPSPKPPKECHPKRSMKQRLVDA